MFSLMSIVVDSLEQARLSEREEPRESKDLLFCFSFYLSNTLGSPLDRKGVSIVEIVLTLFFEVGPVLVVHHVEYSGVLVRLLLVVDQLVEILVPVEKVELFDELLVLLEVGVVVSPSS